MNKKELLDLIVDETQLTHKDTEAVLNSFFDIVTSQIKRGDKVVIAGFGTFQGVFKEQSTAINPITKSEVNIPAKMVAKFKPSKKSKRYVEIKVVKMAKFKKEAKEYFIEDTNIQTHPIKLDVEGQEPKENIIFYKRFLRFKERHKAERVALFFLLVSIIVIAIVVIVWAIIWSQQDIHNDSIRPVAEIHYKANANQQSLISTVQSSTFFTPINK